VTINRSESAGAAAEAPPSSYPPAVEFADRANAKEALYRDAEADRLAFWGAQAERLVWETPFTEVLDWSGAPVAKWFVGGRLNVAYNCVDRHVEAGNGGRVAIHWEGEPVGDARSITYAELKDEVCKAANALSDLGLVAGDRVVPGVTDTKPGSAMTALPGISAKIDDDDGNELAPGTGHGEQVSGYLVLDKPWPSMLRGIDDVMNIARPREIHVVPELPKTRSGKIMRRLLRDVAEGRELGDTSTLLDPSVFEAIRANK
jgi:hypothetical protein